MFHGLGRKCFGCPHQSPCALLPSIARDIYTYMSSPITIRIHICKAVQPLSAGECRQYRYQGWMDESRYRTLGGPITDIAWSNKETRREVVVVVVVIVNTGFLFCIERDRRKCKRRVSSARFVLPGKSRQLPFFFLFGWWGYFFSFIEQLSEKSTVLSVHAQLAPGPGIDQVLYQKKNSKKRKGKGKRKKKAGLVFCFLFCLCFFYTLNPGEKVIYVSD